MKRIFALLLLLALLPACAFAFDVTPYVLPEYERAQLALHLTPISADEFYWVRSVPLDDPEYRYAKTLEHRKGGNAVLNLLLGDDKSSGYQPIVYPDGSLGVLRAIDRVEGNYTWKKDYTLFDAAKDGLSNPRAFEDNPYDLTRLDVGFAGGCEVSPGQSKIVLYDENGNALLHTYFPYENVCVQAFARSGGALYLLAQPNAGGGDNVTLMRIQDGELAWGNAYAEGKYRLNNMHAFLQGGVLMTGSLREDYKRYRVLCIGMDGDTRWEKTLQASKALVHPKLTVPHDDGTATLYGSCVAASRGLYTVFAMTLDADGQALSLDVRSTYLPDASYNDTEPDFFLAMDGTALVHLTLTEDSADKRVLIPFGDLPQAKDPGIRLQ